MFSAVGRFAYGLAPVAREGALWEYIDRRGRVVIAARFAEASPFAEGYARVRDPRTGLMGLIDRDGKLVVPAIFDEIGPFENGLAAYRFGSLWGVLSRDLVKDRA